MEYMGLFAFVMVLCLYGKVHRLERILRENGLAAKLAAGRRVLAVELDPPVDDDPGFFLEGVRALRDAGADAVTISDCPVGRPRADSCLLSCKIRRETGVDPLPHMTCRDRNLNAVKALLLGLSIEGVHNVLLVTGDPIPSQDRDEVKSVFNFNSRKLARYVSGLNETTLRTPFRIFGALNVNAPNFAVQLRLALEKYREAGEKRVLVTCDKSNTASRRTILANGGVLENEVEDQPGLGESGILQRYWITL